MPYHLLADISGHGFGHLAQTAPVLNALRYRLPELQLTIRSGLPYTLLQQHIAGHFTHIPLASDFGLCMKNAVDVDVPASIQRYQALHAQWDTQVLAYAQALAQIKPDLVLANVSYLALAAAQVAQIPTLAMCSLNWLDIFFSYAGTAPGLSNIRTQMVDAYNSATVFLRLTPGMPMPHFQRLTEIGPVARHSTPSSLQLHSKLGLAPTEKFILVAMGGITMPLPSTWPTLPGVHWIVPGETALQRTDMLALESIAMSFSELLAACDGVMTKSAYGTFVEAALCSTPVMYVERPDWPEEPSLVAWIKQHNCAQGISREQFEQGRFGESLMGLLQQPRKTPPSPTGIADAASLIQEKLELCFNNDQPQHLNDLRGG